MKSQLADQPQTTTHAPTDRHRARLIWNSDTKALVLIVALFLACFFMPVGTPSFDNAVGEALQFVKWYAREHVILCLVPAFFIAGAISVFVSQASVMKYLGARAKRVLAYGVASISGTVLAVCSCTVLPLFAGIYRMGAGLGPATAFLYSGPAINVLAIILTARILGMELGIARAVGAILFSVIIGLLMHLFFRKEEIRKANNLAGMPEPTEKRSLWRTTVYFSAMIAILVFANWGRPAEPVGIWTAIYSMKWLLTGLSAAGLALILVTWFGVRWPGVALTAAATVAAALSLPSQPMLAFAVAVTGLVLVALNDKGEAHEWLVSTWGFAKQILPLLLGGVLLSRLLLGRPGHEGLVPSEWIRRSVGGNSLWANLFSSAAGALMYFATLTEVPILQGLLGSGMGKGPALALLLAGPALSLPSMLVIRSILGTRKTLAYVLLVIVMATVTGLLYGAVVG